MLINHPAGLAIMLILLFIGNIYGFITLTRKADEFLTRYHKMNSHNLLLLKIIQGLNIISIIGMWYYKTWAVLLAVVLALLVIVLDIYYKIFSHLLVVLISSSLAAWFIFNNWDLFRSH